MKTKSILHLVALIVIITFVPTQCGFGINQAYASGQMDKFFLRSQQADSNAVGDEIASAIGATKPKKQTAAAKIQRGAKVAATSVLLGAGLFFPNVNALDAQTVQPTPIIESAEHRKPVVITQAHELPILVQAQVETAENAALNRENINELIKQLESYSFLVSSKAEESLVKIGDPAITYLLDALKKSHDIHGKVGIIGTLGRIGSPRAIPQLIDALKSLKPDYSGRIYDELRYPVSEAASRALVEIGAPAIPHLVKLLDDEVSEDLMYRSRDSYRGRIEAPRKRLSDWILDILDDIDSPDAKTYARIYRFIKDKNGTALGNMGEPAVSIAANIFQQLLLLSDFEIETRHVYTYGGYSGYGWGDPVRSPDKNTCLSSEVGDPRAKVAMDLGNIRSSQSVDSLIAALSLKDYKVTYERNRYFDGISGSIPKHTEVVSKVIIRVSTRDISEEAAKALVKIGKPAVPALMEALNNKDKNVRFYAAVALGMIGDERVDRDLVKILKPTALNIFGAKRQMARDALSTIRSRLTREEWAAANKETFLSRSLKITGALLAAIIGFYYILRKKLSRDKVNRGNNSFNAEPPKQENRPTNVSEAISDADAASAAADEPTEAGAIGDIILCGRLYRLTGIWGLDKTGVFEGASREDVAKCIENIKVLGKRLGGYQRQAIRHGILPIVKISKNPEEFRIYIEWLEKLILMSPGPIYIKKETVEEALITGVSRFSVYHPEEGHNESILLNPGDEMKGASSPLYQDIYVVDKTAWTEEVSVDVGRPAPILQTQLLENLSVMQATAEEKTGIVFTLGTASVGLDTMLKQIGVSVTELTNEQMVQLSAATPEEVEVELQKIAAELKVDTVRLCKLQGEAISTVTTEVIEINPAEINAKIVEILRQLGVKFDDTDPVKVEAARKAYEAASVLATGL